MVGFAICFSFLLFTSAYCSDGEGCDSSDDYLNCPEVELVNTFEGDMLGFENLMDILRMDPDTEDFQDSALPDEKKKWVDGIVYYKMSNLFSCNERCIIHEAMHEMERKTCLSFIEDDERQDYISILPNRICGSYVGRQGTVQPLFLASDCANVTGKVIHEFMHAIGFLHENSRRDRDDFITINWDNIPEIHHPQFIKHGLNDVTMYGLPYDYQSIMHYEPYTFARDPTIMTVISKQGQEIGQRKYLSDLDVRRINIHYNCTKKTIGCHDIMSNCRSYQNLQRTCRLSSFNLKCKRTCELCGSRRLIQNAISNEVHCQTPSDRCTKWLDSHNGSCSQKDFRRILRTDCYQSCNNNCD